MNLLNKLTIKNLKLNKKKAIVTIIGIILSVALITAVASMYSSLIASLIKFETNEKGNFHVAFYDVPINEIRTLKNNRQIEDIYLTKNIGYSKLEKSKNEDKPYAYIKAFTPKAFENLSVKLVKGRLPKNENEIVIPTHLRTNGRVELSVGETITLNIGNRVSDNNILNQSVQYQGKGKEKIIDTKPVTYTIVGIIERPANNVEEYSAPGYTFITYTDESNIKDNTDIYVKYTKDGIKNNTKITASILGIDEKALEVDYDKITAKEEEAIIKEMEKAKYMYNENSYLISLETNPINNSTTGELGIVVVIVWGIIVFTSVFCIKNSFDISITEKIKQYGMLRSIGATKKQIKQNVLYEATILGLIGIPLGILSGFIASYILIIISNYFMTDSILSEGVKLYFSFSWISVLVAVLLGIITIYLSAIRSAKKAAKVSPIDSIRNSGEIKIKPKKIKSPKIINKIFGIGGDISYKNLKRNKKKYRTTIISIVVSVSVFIALSSFMNMAFDQVKKEINLQDYNISLSVYNKDLFDKAKQTTKLDNIEDYAIYSRTGINIKNPKYNEEYKKCFESEVQKDILDGYVMVSSIGNMQYKKYIKTLGLDYDNVKDKGILIDNIIVRSFNKENKKEINKQMREFDYRKNDTIEGKLEEKKDVKLEIACVTDKNPFGISNQKNVSILIVSDEFIEKYSDSEKLEICYKSNNATKLQDEIEEMLKDTEYVLDNMEENVKVMSNLFTLVGIFLYGFIIVISLIGITNIFNTITTNMELRKQEFAMLKSIGMSKKEFNKMIRLESIFMGVKSLLFGVPLGICLSYLIYYFLRSEGDKYMLPITAIFTSIIVVFLLIMIIMKYSINKINKQNTIETIRNENI